MSFLAASSESCSEPAKRHKAVSVFRLIAPYKVRETPLSLLRVGRAFLHFFRDPVNALSWLAYIRHMERELSLPEAMAGLAAKPLSSYAIWRLPLSDRVRMLKSHYTDAAAAFRRDVFLDLWRGNSVTLGLIAGRSGKQYQLVIMISPYHSKEGECTFCLVDSESGIVLAALTFTLARPDRDTKQPSGIFIGGLQGPSSDCCGEAKRRVVDATRDLHGLRPKMAVLSAVLALGKSIGVDVVSCVSNDLHVNNEGALFQPNRLRTSYDEFWIERGGKAAPFGYELPLEKADRSRPSRTAGYQEVIKELVRGILNNNG